MQSDVAKNNLAGLAAVVMLFSLLLLASYSNEILRQFVIAPGSSAELGVAADCRADELEEEQLSLEECRLMVTNLSIILHSSPPWFRSFQIVLASLGIVATLVSLAAAFNLLNRQTPPIRLLAVSIGLLLLLDVGGFLAAVNIGPLLRARYLWPLLMWFVVHLCLLMATVRLIQQRERRADT